MTSSEIYFYETIGRKMKMARLYFDFEKQMVSQALCISEEELDSYEEGKKEISLYLYKKIEKILNFNQIKYEK